MKTMFLDRAVHDQWMYSSTHLHGVIIILMFPNKVKGLILFNVWSILFKSIIICSKATIQPLNN